MRVRRVLRIILLSLLTIVLLAGVFLGSLWAYLHPEVKRTNAVAYGERDGKPLHLDVLQPGKTNGLAVLLLVSGGWKSAPSGSFQPWLAAPLLRRGYTLFTIYHISQPETTVMEITEDIHRAVRFVRHHASEYGIDPQRLGVTGGSAGGHLSLLLATRGGPCPANAPDPVDRESSAVQAVAIFFPVTDLLNLGASTENPGDGGPPKSFVKAFGPQSTNLAVWKVTGHDLSPIYYLGSNLPPVLIFHGDADTLVPLDQSERFQTAAKEAGATVDLVIRHKAGHGWGSMIWDLRRFAEWFDRHLRPARQ